MGWELGMFFLFFLRLMLMAEDHRRSTVAMLLLKVDIIESHLVLWQSKIRKLLSAWMEKMPHIKSTQPTTIQPCCGKWPICQRIYPLVIAVIAMDNHPFIIFIDDILVIYHDLLIKHGCFLQLPRGYTRSATSPVFLLRCCWWFFGHWDASWSSAWCVQSMDDIVMTWDSSSKVRYEATQLPSGKHTKNYGKSPCFMGKLTINGHFQ